MSVGRRLAQQAKKTARLQEQLTDSFTRELGIVLKQLTRQVRSLIREFDAQDGRVVRTAAAIGRAVRVRSDLMAALVDSGFTRAVVDALDEPLDRLTREILKGNAIARAAAESAVDVQAIAAFKDVRLAELLGYGEDIAAQLWRTVLDGVLGVRPVDDLIADIEDIIDGSAAEARTLYDTAVSTYSRQVDQMGATGKPDELFLYVGPTDAKTRQFCKDIVGKVFTRSEIDEMDNGQLPNVMLTGGGYNCRHTWKRVSVLDQELLDLRDKGGRLPNVEDALEEINA